MVGKFKTKAHKLDEKLKNRSKINEAETIVAPLEDVQSPLDFVRNLQPQQISGIGKITSEEQKVSQGNVEENRTIYYTESEKVFLVTHDSTLEVRTESKLGKTLREKYETVMESRYFGRGGIEIVPSGQLTTDEIDDLIRLSYNLSEEM